MPSKREDNFRNEFMIKDNIVYHYCSLQALFSIITSQSFWLTSLNSTNDKKELIYSKSIFETALNELIQDESYKELNEHLQKIKNAPKSKIRIKANNYYGMCFVRNKDSLTHWERYANNCKGVCIAVNLSVLDNWLSYNVLDWFTKWLRHSKVVYNYDEQIKKMKSSLTDELVHYDNTVLKPAGEALRNHPEVYSVFYYNTLSRYRPIFKHTGFMDENEYRLIFEEGDGESTIKLVKSLDVECAPTIANNLENVLGTLNLKLEHKKFSLFGDSIRSLYALSLREFWSDTLIPEIIIGPKCYQNKKELIAFLKANGLLMTKVRVSNVPIR